MSQLTIKQDPVMVSEPELELVQADFSGHVWGSLEVYLNRELSILHKKMEADLTERETDVVRGEIKRIRTILGLNPYKHGDLGLMA